MGNSWMGCEFGFKVIDEVYISFGYWVKVGVRLGVGVIVWSRLGLEL